MEMEVPVINRIGDFEAYPSFVSQIFSVSAVAKFHQPCVFLKWGALILAFVACFSTIINRIKFSVFRLQSLIFRDPKSIQQVEDYSYDSDTDSCSSVSSDDDEKEDEDKDEDEPSVSFYSQSWRSVDEDFIVKGSSRYSDHQWQNRSLRKRRNRSIKDMFSSFSEIANGNNVVKLWDNIGLGLRFNSGNESTNHISVFDAICEQNLFSIFGDKSEISAVSVSPSSLPVIVSTENDVSAHFLKVWDTRVGGRMPGILAEWKPKLGKFVGIGGGGGSTKVYVRDEVTGSLMVGDMRKLRSPLGTTESNSHIWCDADGRIAGETESVDYGLTRWAIGKMCGQ